MQRYRFRLRSATHWRGYADRWSRLRHRPRQAQRLVAPRAARLGRQASHEPQSDAGSIAGEAIREPPYASAWVRLEASRTVEQMLRRIVGAVANERLGVDDQPWLPYRAQDIPGVQICGQKHIVRRRRRQVLEECHALADQPGV